MLLPLVLVLVLESINILTNSSTGTGTATTTSTTTTTTITTPTTTIERDWRAWAERPYCVSNPEYLLRLRGYIQSELIRLAYLGSNDHFFIWGEFLQKGPRNFHLFGTRSAQGPAQGHLCPGQQTAALLWIFHVVQMLRKRWSGNRF